MKFPEPNVPCDLALARELGRRDIAGTPDVPVGEDGIDFHLVRAHVQECFGCTEAWSEEKLRLGWTPDAGLP